MLVVVSFAPAGRFPPQSSPPASPAPLVILISVSQSVSVVTASEEHGHPQSTTGPHYHTPHYYTTNNHRHRDWCDELLVPDSDWNHHNSRWPQVVQLDPSLFVTICLWSENLQKLYGGSSSGWNTPSSGLSTGWSGLQFLYFPTVICYPWYLIFHSLSYFISLQRRMGYEWCR